MPIVVYITCMLIFRKLLNVPCSVFTIMTHAPLVYVFLLKYVCLLSGAFCFVSCVKSDVSWFNPGQILHFGDEKNKIKISSHGCCNSYGPKAGTAV